MLRVNAGFKKILPYCVCLAVVILVVFYRYTKASFSDPVLNQIYNRSLVSVYSSSDLKNKESKPKPAEPIEIVATIISEPEDRKTSWRYAVKIDRILQPIHVYKNTKASMNDSGDDITYSPKDSKFLVRDMTQNLSQHLEYGDQILFSATLKKPQNIESSDGRVFDYAQYLSKDDIFYIAETEDVSVFKKAPPSLQGMLFRLKSAFVKNIEKHIPAPHSYLGEGLVISGKGSLDKDLQTEFQKVGLIHIVVLSGFNISIVGETIVRVFSFLPKVIGGVFGAGGIVLFGLMTGGGATVWRSVVMSIIGIYARLSGRKNSAIFSLFLAGSFMLFFTPKLLMHDPSFQLSFMATLGLILFSEPFETRLLKIYMYMMGKIKCLFGQDSLVCFLYTSIPKSLISLIASTLATQIFTLPMIIRFSGVVSLVALPVNIIVLPLIPLTMLLVFVTGVASFISDLFAVLPAFVSWALLSFELFIVHISSGLSFASIKLNQISLKAFLFMYVLLGALAVVLHIDSIIYFFSSQKNNTRALM